MKAVITVIGKDMVGILAKISTECCNHNINVLEVTQSILQDMFCMIMMADISNCSIPFAEFKAQARPEIKGYVEDVSGYDTIFVCFPCWCGTAPMCVFTFLEHYDLAGKKIVPLCTNEGSGMANAVGHLQNSCKGADVLPGLAILGHTVKDSEETIATWATSQL